MWIITLGHLLGIPHRRVKRALSHLGLLKRINFFGEMLNKFILSQIKFV